MQADQPDHTPWYQPRTAEIIMRGGEGFANSIGNGLDKLADGLGKFLEKRREEGKLEVANGKAALATLKASPSLQKSLNITPEDAERMSPAERSAAVFGGLAGMKQEEGFRAGQAQTAKILADALTQRQEAEGNTAFDLAQAAASRPGTLEIPNTTLPGIFPDRTVGTRSQPTLQEAAQQILQTPGAARSRAGIQLLEAAAREREQQMGEGAPFYNRSDVGNLMPVQGAPGYGIAVTGPRQSQVIYTGGPQGSSVAVPGVGDVGVITTKPGQSTIVPGQQTQGQVREALAKTEADIAKLRTKIKGDPEMEKYLAGALAEQESLAASYRQALGTAAPSGDGGQGKGGPAVGTVMGGYRFKGGNPNQKENWEQVK